MIHRKWKPFIYFSICVLVSLNDLIKMHPIETKPSKIFVFSTYPLNGSHVGRMFTGCVRFMTNVYSTVEVTFKCMHNCHDISEQKIVFTKARRIQQKFLQFEYKILQEEDKNGLASFKIVSTEEIFIVISMHHTLFPAVYVDFFINPKEIAAVRYVLADGLEIGFVVVSAYDEAINVLIHFRSHKSEKGEIGNRPPPVNSTKRQKRTINNKDTLFSWSKEEIDLLPYQSKSAKYLDGYEKIAVELEGESPFAVMTGKEKLNDLIISIVSPHQEKGSSFIVPGGDQYDTIITCLEVHVVVYTSDSSLTKRFELMSKLDYVKLTLLKLPLAVSSKGDIAINVFQYLEGSKDICDLNILPLEKWGHNYAIKREKPYDVITMYFVAKTRGFMINDNLISSDVVSYYLNVLNEKDYVVQSTRKIFGLLSELIITHVNANKPFYMIALKRKYGAIFSRSSYRSCFTPIILTDFTIRCRITKTVPNDKIDNDCDHKVDEEIQNEVDDDHDGEVDEDLAKLSLGRSGTVFVFSIFPTNQDENDINLDYEILGYLKFISTKCGYIIVNFTCEHNCPKTVNEQIIMDEYSRFGKLHSFKYSLSYTQHLTSYKISSNKEIFTFISLNYRTINVEYFLNPLSFSASRYAVSGILAQGIIIASAYDLFLTVTVRYKSKLYLFDGFGYNGTSIEWDVDDLSLKPFESKAVEFESPNKTEIIAIHLQCMRPFTVVAGKEDSLYLQLSLASTLQYRGTVYLVPSVKIFTALVTSMEEKLPISVTYSSNGIDVSTLQLEDFLDNAEISVHNLPLVLKSEHRFTVKVFVEFKFRLIHSAHCTWNILPLLFWTSYYIVHQDQTSQIYLFFIAERSVIGQIYLNHTVIERPTATYHFKFLEHTKDYSVSNAIVVGGDTTQKIWQRNSNHFYVMGLSGKAGQMYLTCVRPLSFSKPINESCRSSFQKDDFMQTMEITTWGPWGSWTCEAACGESNGTLVRKRICLDKNCTGSENESSSKTCLAEVFACECPTGNYGRNCSQFCNNCQDFQCSRDGSCKAGCKFDYKGRFCNLTCKGNCEKCSSMNGSCEQCLPGYVNDQSCSEKCPRKYFGHSCKNLCSSTCYLELCNASTGTCLGCPQSFFGPYCRSNCFKCSQGCDRQGACVESSKRVFPKQGWIIAPIVIISLVLVFTALAIYIIRRKKKDEEASKQYEQSTDDEENDEDDDDDEEDDEDEENDDDEEESEEEKDDDEYYNDKYDEQQIARSNFYYRQEHPNNVGYYQKKSKANQ